MAEPTSLSPPAALARAHDPDRFLCALFAPPERREALFALVAYNHELARARAAARNPIAALMRLQWWRDTVEAAAAGGRPPPRHEVAGPLHAAIAAGALDPADLLAMADAREAEAEEGGIPTRDAFAAYLRGTAGGFAVAAGRLLGAPPALLPALQEAGTAYGLAGVLRSVPALAAQQGRVLLPEDALAEAGLGAEQAVAEPQGAAVRRVAEALARAGQDQARGGAAALREGALPRRAVAAALPLVLARRDLRRLASAPARAWTAERGLGDRLAVVLAGLRGRV